MNDLNTLQAIFDRSGLNSELISFNGEDYSLLLNDQVRFSFNTDGSLKNYHIYEYGDRQVNAARNNTNHGGGGIGLRITDIKQ